MAVIKIKIISSIAGENFSYAPGDIVDLDEAIAREWEAAGLSIPAPDGEIAAGQIADLKAQLADVTGARDGLAAAKTDLEGQLANAKAEKGGAIADKVIHKKAADDAQTALSAAQKAASDAAAKAASDLAEAKAATAATEKERDDFKTQAEELGKQLADALAQNEALKSAGATPPAAAPETAQK